MSCSSLLLEFSLLGYGTWQSAPGEVGAGVFQALKTGYRHLVRTPSDPSGIKAWIGADNW